MMSDCPERADGGGLVALPPRITGQPEEPFRVLHKGFDGLDMAFMGALRPDDVTALERARDQAENDQEPALALIGPGEVAMHVAPHGIKGGFRFACDTGFLGEKWFFTKAQDRSRWNIRVSAKSLPLAIYGSETVYNKLRDTLDALGITPGAESVGRVDYAIDFLMSSAFALSPDQFVVHSRTGTSEYASSLVEERIGPDDLRIYFSGRHVSSITIGKQPGRQVIVYDKRREIIAKQKLYWFDLWGIENCEPGQVLRVEFRAGKKHLRHWQVKTFDDLRAQIGDLFLNSVKAVRYVIAEGNDANITRRPVHPLWKAVRQELESGLFDNVSGIVPGRIISGEGARLYAQYLDQISALVPGALIASGYGGDRPKDQIHFLLAKVARHMAIDPEKFLERYARARERMHFIRIAADQGGFGSPVSPPTET